MDVVDAVILFKYQIPLALLQIPYHVGELKVVEILGMEACVVEEAEVNPKRNRERNDFSRLQLKGITRLILQFANIELIRYYLKDIYIYLFNKYCGTVYLCL